MAEPGSAFLDVPRDARGHLRAGEWLRLGDGGIGHGRFSLARGCLAFRGKFSAVLE